MVKRTDAKQLYKDKFLDPQWQQFRLKVFERDEFKCVRCDDKNNTLHAHHTYYEAFGNDPWEYELDTVITLCDSCHTEEHAYLKEANRQLLNSLSSTGISWEDKASVATAFDVLPKKLPVDFWDVIMVLLVDESFYKLAQQKYYNDTEDWRVEAVKKLRWDKLALIVENTNG
jgi:hypothetical protein